MQISTKSKDDVYIIEILGRMDSISSKEIEAGNYIQYEHINYEGDISLFRLGTLHSYWTDYEAGNLDRLFPTCDIRVTELDETGAQQDTYVLDTLSGIRTDAAQLRFDLEAGFEGRLTLYRYGNPPSAVTGNLVVPERRDSYLGLLVEQKTAFGWEWADFNWVHIAASERPPEPSSTPVSLPLRVTSTSFVT